MQAHGHGVVQAHRLARQGLALGLGGVEVGQGLVQGRRLGAQHGLEGVGRKAGTAALGQLHLGEAHVVVVLQGPVQGMVRVAGLDQHLPRQPGAAAAAAHLHELGEQALRRPEVGGEQGGVGVEHTHQGEAGKVVALGQHLGAHQDVGLAPVDPLQQGLPLALAAGAVPVGAQQARAGKAHRQGRLQALGTAAERQDVLVAATGAVARDRLLAPAVVAAQPPVGQVQHQIGGAGGATAYPAAGRASQHRGVAAPVEEHQTLFAALQARGDSSQ